MNNYVTFFMITVFSIIAIFLYSISINFILYIINKYIISSLIIIGFLPLYCLLKVIYKFQKKINIGSTSYLTSGGYLHMINGKEAITLFKTAKDNNILSEIAIFNCYIATTKLTDGHVKWSTYSHIISEELMKKISIDIPKVKSGFLIEYSYLNSCIGKFGVKESIKNASKLIGYIRGIERCIGKIDSQKIDLVLKELYEELDKEREAKFHELSMKMFGESYKNA